MIRKSWLRRVGAVASKGGYSTDSKFWIEPSRESRFCKHRGDRGEASAQDRCEWHSVLMCTAWMETVTNSSSLNLVMWCNVTQHLPKCWTRWKNESLQICHFSINGKWWTPTNNSKMPHNRKPGVVDHVHLTEVLSSTFWPAERKATQTQTLSAHH